MDTVQRATLRKAAVWFATILVVLQCGWVIGGCALGLAAIDTNVFPGPMGMSEEMMLVILSSASLLLLLQVFGVWRGSFLCSFFVSVAFLLLGGFAAFGFAFAAFALLTWGVSWSDLWVLFLPLIFIVTWLYIGFVMMAHANKNFENAFGEKLWR